MALEMFLRVDGATGGSRNYHHKGWADVLSWSWNLQQLPAASENGELTPRMNEISLVKTIGMDSAALMQLLAARTPIPTAAISVVPVVGKRDAQQKYLAVTLQDVQIMSITAAGSTEENFFTENVTLRFGKVSYEYNEYAAVGSDGKPVPPTAYTFGWDTAANVAC